MSCPLGLEELNKLKEFITLCTSNPQILNIPQLDFFKAFIEQLGGKVPPGQFKMPSFTNTEPKPTAAPEPTSPAEADLESEPDSDVELDMTGVIEGDKDEPQPMGDETKTPTEEELEEASTYRTKAASAYGEQKYEEAIELYTKAIELNPGNALFHAKRGQAYLKLQKPNACIRDCDRALELNCDSAPAYKFRGRAHRLLGNWEQAAKDLRQACNIDYDEEADIWLKEVTPNAKKIEQHRIKQERKKAEKELRQKQERLRKAQEANKKAHEEQSTRTGGTTAGGSAHNFQNMFGANSADIFQAFNDPEVAAAMQDIMANPGNIIKYQSNPKIMNLISKIGSAMSGPGFPGAGGFPGADLGAGGAGTEGFPGFGQTTGTGGAPKPDPRPDFSDDGLD